MSALGVAGDYLQLTKPRLVLLAALTAAVSFWMADSNPARKTDLIKVFAGSLGVGAAASVFNQVLERRADARMKRTERRPIPAGRLSAPRAVIFAAALASAGLGMLLWADPLAAGLGGLTLAVYLGAYTPLKTRTPWNTLVGAVPGALPCLIGWAAARGRLESEALALFAILFLWQLPHFFSIAWVYREDYRSAGFRMLSTSDATGRQTAVQIVFFSLLLTAASFIPVKAGWGGPVYFLSALSAGAALVVLSAVLAATRLRFARGFATVSIYYLVVLMTGLAVDRL